MMAKLKLLLTPVIAGAAVVAISVAPVAHSDPPPLPPCGNADGTTCSNISAGGANINIPYGPAGTADRGGASGAIPYGPSGSADRGGASGCWFNLGCISIPAP